MAGARCFPPEGRRCPGGPWASAWPVGSCAGAAGNAQLRDGCDRWLNRPPAQRRRRPPRRQMSLSACFLAYTFFSPGNPEAPTQPPPPARSSGRAKRRRNFQKDLEERKGVLRGGGVGGDTTLRPGVPAGQGPRPQPGDCRRSRRRPLAQNLRDSSWHKQEGCPPARSPARLPAEAIASGAPGTGGLVPGFESLMLMTSTGARQCPIGQEQEAAGPPRQGSPAPKPGLRRGPRPHVSL